MFTVFCCLPQCHGKKARNHKRRELNCVSSANVKLLRKKKTISRTGKHRVKLGQDQNSILKLVYTLTLSSRRETKLCILYEVVATKSTKTSCCSHDNINKIFKLQKRCARIILDAQQRHGTVDQVIFQGGCHITSSLTSKDA